MVTNWEIARTIFSGLTLVSIYLAYRTYRSNLDRQIEDKKVSKDKEILEQAIRSLSWAYDILTNGNPEEIPEACRINWLTSARHIIRYCSLKKLIETETYKLICDENEEYWRHKFYVLLDQPELADRHYYMDSENSEWPENIEITSAMIINDFSSWNDSLDDPIDEIDRDSLIENGQPYRGSCGRGLRSYVNEIERIKSGRSD